MTLTSILAPVSGPLSGRVSILPDEPAWLAERQAHIGGTDAAAILGLSPWAGPWDVFSSKRHGTQQERSPEELVKLAEGRRWERHVLEEYMLERPAVQLLDQPGILHVTHAAHPWASASPDALGTEFPSGVMGGVEAKAYGDPDQWNGERVIVHAPPLEEGVWPIPVHVAVQVLWYLEVTGLPWWDVAVLLPRQRRMPECRVYRVYSDAARQRELLERVGEWRERHLVAGVEPTIDGSEACLRHVVGKYDPDPDKPVRAATEEEAALVAAYASLGRQIQDREASRAQVRNELLAAIGAGYGLTFPGPDGKPAKALAIRAKGRTTISVSDVEKSAPDIFTALKERGLVKHGEPSTSIRTYNL
jgi:hypothetical protein